MGQELFYIHFFKENQTVARPDAGRIMLIEIVFTHQQLNIVELVHPNHLCQRTELSIVRIAWERRIYLAEIAIGEGVLHH